jgi:EAL domain-containing protein (putative c-di-GMP-specific phosphodiesterase class I)
VGPLFADPRTNAIILRRLDRQIRDDALRRLHEAPSDWFLSLNISPRWISRLRPDQPLPSLKQLSSQASIHGASCSRSRNWAAISSVWPKW